jgi:hypothetical protein
MTEQKISYIPPTVIEPFYGQPYELAPGVLGIAINHSEKVYIPFIEAINEGNRSVGNFIDSLDKKCVFVEVLKPKLKKMLSHRGWKQIYEKDEDGNKIPM